MSYFSKVKDYLAELGFEIVRENAAEELVVITHEWRGIKNMVLDCEGDLLVIEQSLLQIREPDVDSLTKLLQMNRTLVHGALALDESGRRLIFRDTLELSNLDINELDATLHALGFALAEHGFELLQFAHINSNM